MNFDVAFHASKIYCTQFFWGAFQISPNIRKFWLEIKWNEPFRIGPTGIFGTTFEGGSLWPVHSFRSVLPKSPFHLAKWLSPVPLFCILLAAGTITKHAVAWNGSVKPEWTVPLGTWNFRNFKAKFLLNGKRRGTGVSFSNSQYQGFLVPRDLLQKSTGEEVVHVSA